MTQFRNIPKSSSVINARIIINQKLFVEENVKSDENFNYIMENGMR